MIPSPSPGELVLTRLLAAPRTQVFQAWTDPERLARWWGPAGFTNPVCELEPKPGGAIRILMRAPDGTEYPMGGAVRDVDAPRRLVFTATAHEEADGIPGLENLNTITFEEQDGGTALTVIVQVLRHTPTAAPALAGMAQGWGQSLDRLEALVRP